MTTSSQAPSTAYQSCLDEGVRQSSLLIKNWCFLLGEDLQERSRAVSDPVERQSFHHASMVLRMNQPVIEQTFVRELTQAMTDDASLETVKKTPGAPRALSSLSFDDLELMGDHQVQDAVERARLQQIVRLACDSTLSGFVARLSTVQGFEMVRADRNPLSPEIVSKVLLKLLDDMPITAPVRACWLMYGAQIMGDGLQSLYMALDRLLAAQGVPPAAYGVISSPESKAGIMAYNAQVRALQGGGWGGPAGVVESGRLSLQDELPAPGQKRLLTIDHLRHFLAGDYDQPGKGKKVSLEAETEEIIHRDFSPTVPGALNVLAELEAKGLDAAQLKKIRPAPPLPVAQLREHLKTEAKSMGQSLAIEVVGLMIGQIAHDERLLAPVRQVIANSESAFLRLAATDPRFFSEKTHPARQLLETITNTSLGYASESSAGFPEFMQNLQEVSLLLTEEHASDAQHFARLLEDFQRRQASYTPENQKSRQLAVQSLLQAEQRNLLAEKIGAEIRGRSDFVADNRIIATFLTGPWAQVMARERLLLAEQQGAGSPKAVFSLTLGDLLWSLDLAKVSNHRKRLVQMIPGMLTSLRDGLVSIDYPLEQSKVFFEELMRLHQAGLKAQPESPAPDTSNRHALEKMFVADQEFDVSQPWLAPSEAQHSGFMADWDRTAPAGSTSEQAASPEPVRAAGIVPPVSGAVVNLPLGAWVEMLVDAQWMRAQLTWVSPENTLYLFISEGGRKHSMTARVLQHLLALSFVKVVSQQGVVDGALDSVANVAMRNSLDSNSRL